MFQFKRTENGITTNVSIREGLDEVEHAARDFEELGIKSLSSAGSTHFIEYADGRRVKFERVEVPDAKPVTVQGRKCLEFVRDAGRPVPTEELRRARFNGNTLNSLDGCLRFRPDPYIRRTPEGYVLTELGRNELNR